MIQEIACCKNTVFFLTPCQTQNGMQALWEFDSQFEVFSSIVYMQYICIVYMLKYHAEACTYVT